MSGAVPAAVTAYMKQVERRFFDLHERGFRSPLLDRAQDWVYDEDPALLFQARREGRTWATKLKKKGEA